MSDAYCFGCSKELSGPGEYCDACLRAIRPESVCEHGGLKRVCLICEQAAEIERLRGEVAQLRGLISAVNEDEWYQRVCAYEHQIAALRQQARMPEELAERVRDELQLGFIDVCSGEFLGPEHRLLNDILAWHEQQERSDE